jgi:hypothetical protein
MEQTGPIQRCLTQTSGNRMDLRQYPTGQTMHMTAVLHSMSGKATMYVMVSTIYNAGVDESSSGEQCSRV